MERGILGEEAFSARTVCQISLLLGRYSEAVRACEKAAAQQNWWVDHAWLTAGYAQNGEMTKAAIAKNELLKQKPRFTIDKLKATDTALNNSAYLQRAETHFYSGLRKAGLADK
jgi:hypothetical protein